MYVSFPIFPHLVHIEVVRLKNNPGITMATYESLVEVVKSTREVKMKTLEVAHKHEDSLKRMFAQYPEFYHNLFVPIMNLVLLHFNI